MDHLSERERTDVNSILTLCQDVDFADGMEECTDLVKGDDLIRKIVKQYFGFNELKALQSDIIKAAVFDGKDVLAIMATGYGKSLCYQLPALLRTGVVLVISPLIALMHDQVLALKLVNVCACLLSPSSTHGSLDCTKKDILAEKYKIVYLTPEFATKSQEFIKEVDKKVGVILLAIDEAHCISRWGHDFRHSYRQLGELRDWLPHAPFVAVTATANATVQNDIIASLRMDRSRLLHVTSSVNRTNLFLSASFRSQNPIDDLLTAGFIVQQLNGPNRISFDGPTIIYCRTRSMTELVYKKLDNAGASVVMYHAGLNNDLRTSAQFAFVADECQVVVATIAFGMGIDKPDIRNVVHYGAPRDLDSYYQEIGRGGRDGQRCRCHAFFDKQDLVLNKRLIGQSESDANEHQNANDNHLKHQYEMQRKMEIYLTTNDKCRRMILLEHFGENIEEKIEWCCDICTNRLQSAFHESALEDVSVEARILFRAVNALKGRYGSKTYIQFVRGSTSSKITDRMRSLREYASASKNRCEGWWKNFVHQMMLLGYLDETPLMGTFGGCVLGLSSLGRQLLASNDPIKISKFTPHIRQSRNRELPAVTISRFTSNNVETRSICILPHVLVNERPWQNASLTSSAQRKQPVLRKPGAIRELEALLYALLLSTRNNIAARSGISAHRVATNKTLSCLAERRPLNLNQLSDIEGFPIAKAQTVGHAFIEVIEKFCEEHAEKLGDDCRNCEEHERSSDSDEHEMVNEIAATKALDCLITQDQKNIYRSVQFERKSIDQISHEKSYILNNLMVAIVQKLPVDIELLGIDEEMIDNVEKCIRSSPVYSDVGDFEKVRDAVQCSNLIIDAAQLNFIISILKLKYGLGVCSGSKDNSTKTPTHCSIQNNGQNGKRLPGWMTCSSPPAKLLVKQVAKKKRNLKL